ncbi:hypothetical protein [Bradyrhizobium sp. RDM4]|uniref:hypothetical protein n=1 Tax=Bradyrhizobium sp. RDM4 TaxID=3378765 RepID=UPI0038FC72B5
MQEELSLSDVSRRNCQCPEPEGWRKAFGVGREVVADGLDTAKSQSRIKNNVFATGFLDGVSATRGCSAKGKFWSISSVRDLTDWIECCEDIGRAVNDSGITTDGVFKSAMRPRQIADRPAVPPVAIHWPESPLMQIEDRVEISFGDQSVLFTECDIDLIDHERTGPLRFAVRSDAHVAEFDIVFNDGGARYPQRKGSQDNHQDWRQGENVIGVLW